MSIMIVTSGQYQFVLNSVFTYPSEGSLTPEEVIENEQIAYNQGLMISDFENDPIKLDYFKSLLASNPSTAYITYMNNRQ